MDIWKENWRQELEASGVSFLVVSGQATLRQAFALLGSPEVKGQPWWHLVVARTDGTWAAGTFADLYNYAKTAGEGKLDVPLDEPDWLLTVKAFDQAEIGIGEAKGEARRAPGQMVVITDGNELVGILYVGTQRGAEQEAVSTSALTALAGGLIDLKEVGHLLIKKHKPKLERTLKAA